MISQLLAFAAVVTLADRPAEIVDATRQDAYKAWLRLAAVEAEGFFSLHTPCETASVNDRSTRVLALNNPSPGYAPEVALEALTVSGCGRQMNVNLAVIPRQDRRE
jgi:hypothetical protein